MQSTMQTVQINLPDSVVIDPGELKLILASRLYEMRVLSLGQAAEVAGVSKRAFIELLGRYDVSVFNDSPDTIGDDYEHA